MAPALVEHPASKGRNSVTKKFLNNLSCMPQLSLVLADKLGCVDTPSLLNKKMFGSTKLSNNHTEKNNSFEPKLMVSPLQDSSPITSCSTPLTSKDFTFVSPVINKKNDIIQENVDTTYEKAIPRNHVKEQCATLERLHPVASPDAKDVINYLKLKQDKVKVKYYDINQSISSIELSLKKLCSRNISSHVACHLSKHVHNTDDSGTKTENDNTLSSCSLTSVTESPVDKLLESQTQKLYKIRKIHDLTGYLNNDTDHEEDFDSRVRVPVSHGKKKSQHPPPTTSALHQWKQKRAKIGSQCTWLSLQIHSLDKRIEKLDQINRKLKIERHASKVLNTEPCENRVNTELTSEKNGVIPLSSSTSSLDDQVMINHGCSRTSPVSYSYSHKYINNTLLPEVKGSYKCHNLHSSLTCRLCVQTRSRGSPCAAADCLHETLDASYHSNLSYANDISLSYSLEETLCTKRINTKVTITKPTKKKKKLKVKDIPPSLLKQPEKEKPKNSVVEEKTHSRTKNERSKSDEYTRKRSLTSEYSSSGRVRKLRKFSESLSCDSSKPSTPTNELSSPLSQSLNSSGLFTSFNKNKKKLSSGGDYDINNIVIPYSIAASTRVERIQYKEIPTPGWRNIEEDLLDEEVELERELTDEEVISERHARCEVLERKRFCDYFQPSRRPRPNRLSEGQLSEPPSPIIVDEPAGTPADSPNPSSFKIFDRSSNLTPYSEEERELSWTVRKFPLNEKESKELTASSDLLSPVVSPTDSKTLASLKQVSHALMRSTRTPRHSPLQSPTFLSSPGTPTEHDSNWTVKLLNDPPIDVVTSEKQRKGIVLKLAKK